MSDLTDLAAAIRDALKPSAPRQDDTAGWRLYDRLIVNRACHVRGVLGALAGGDDSAAMVGATVRVITATAELLPVNYRTCDESPCLRGEHARCAGCTDCPQDCHPEKPGGGS